MRQFGVILIAAFIWLAFSCGGHKLKTDEKALSQQILTEEEQLAQQEAAREEREKQLADSIAKLPKGFRFKENRKVDSNNPPIVIDIIGSRAQVSQPVKLTQLFTKVEYIRLEQLQDTNELKKRISYIVSPEGLFIKTGKGSIHQYNKNGHLIRTICTGNRQSLKVAQNDFFDNMGKTVLFEGADDVYWNGNKLCYLYKNQQAQRKYLIAFDDQLEGGTPSVQLPGSTESKLQINGKGEIKTELRIPKSRETWTPYLLGNSTMALITGTQPYDPQEYFLNVLSTSGDTMCEFKNYDPIINFTKPVSRGVDDGDSYYFNGVLHIRQAFNDTIYQLIPPNRLVPKYILNLGEMGIKSANQGVDPGFSLKEKLVLQAFLETNRYIFITYSKDYDCPNTAKSGTLKYSRLIFDKKNKTLIPVYQDEAPFIPIDKMVWHSAPNLNIKNDLDNVPFNWPTSATANGRPYVTMRGDELLKLKIENLPVKNIKKNDRIIAIYH